MGSILHGRQPVEEGHITVNGLEVRDVIFLHPHRVDHPEAVGTVEESKLKDVLRMGIAHGQVEVAHAYALVVDEGVKPPAALGVDRQGVGELQGRPVAVVDEVVGLHLRIHGAVDRRTGHKGQQHSRQGYQLSHIVSSI